GGDARLKRGGHGVANQPRLRRAGDNGTTITSLHHIMNNQEYLWSGAAFELSEWNLLRSDAEGDHHFTIGRYYERGDIASRFAFRFTLARPKGPIPVAFGSGLIGRCGASDGRPFLAALVNDLGGSPEVAADELVEYLEFSCAILGRNLSLGQGGNVTVAGRFTDVPAGGWIVLKLFLGPSEAEAYLILDTTGLRAQFIPKDADGPEVVAQLARVLLPKATQAE
ncbi:MAG: hypothetical protein ABMA26_22800, partial [Limisphaerales bacterium]